ncbi:MAG: endonuclease/exonuclease/phosphatase family protein [Rikenellaceae bacterium]
MKKNLSLVVTLLVSLVCFGQTNQQISVAYPNHEVVRVISYNIWNGFENQSDVYRMEECASWIKEIDPEIVALQELCGFTEEKLAKFAKMYGHDYVAIQKENGYPIGVTSKRPIEKIHVNTKDMGHGFIHVKTYGIDIIATHLTPFNCNNRLAEARLVTSYISDNKLEKFLVMGDLNSHSPFDAEQIETHTELVRNYAVYGQNYPDKDNIRGDLLDYSVISHFISHPMEDVIRLYVPVKERMTYPAFFLHADNYKGKEHLLQRGERIDYIFSSYSLINSCINGHVWNGEDTKYLSDHFPVGIDMLLKMD